MNSFALLSGVHLKNNAALPRQARDKQVGSSLLFSSHLQALPAAERFDHARPAPVDRTTAVACGQAHPLFSTFFLRVYPEPVLATQRFLSQTVRGKRCGGGRRAAAAAAAESAFLLLKRAFLKR